MTASADQLIECRRIAILEARRRGLSVADAEDVAQAVCILFWNALAKGKTIRNVGAWSRTAAARAAIRLVRDARAQKRGGGLVESLTGVDEAKFAH